MLLPWPEGPAVSYGYAGGARIRPHAACRRSGRPGDLALPVRSGGEGDEAIANGGPGARECLTASVRHCLGLPVAFVIASAVDA
jgi:hypothetical protein